MRFNDVKFDDIDTNIDGKHDCVFNILSSDELVDVTNEIRAKQGYDNFVGVEYDNFEELYYNFYLYINADEMKIRMDVQVYDEKEPDDYWHNIELTPEEERMLLWKAIKYFL